MLKTKTKSRTRSLVAGVALAALCAATSFAAWAAQPPGVTVVRLAASAPAPVPAPALQATAKPEDQSKPAAPAKSARVSTNAPPAVCVTNACMVKEGKQSASISDAIAKGDARAVVNLGGSGMDAVQALRVQALLHNGNAIEADSLKDAARVDVTYEKTGWVSLNGYDADGHYLGAAMVTDYDTGFAMVSTIVPGANQTRATPPNNP